LAGTAWNLAARSLELPATFRGDASCGDCASVRHHLDLWPDHVFHLRREWSGMDMRRDEIGRWRIDEARRVLLLEGGGEMPLQFQVAGPRILRVLDVVGSPAAPPATGDLRSDGRIDALPMSLFVGGEVVPDGESLRFDECLTGRSYAIAPGAEAQRLAQDRRARMADHGGPLYVTFEGTLQPATMTLADGRTRAIVVVDRYVGAWPGHACERSRADASLANTYWRIVQLQGDPPVTVAGRREAHLLLRQDGEHRSFAASTGCNALQGRWRYTAQTVSFEREVMVPHSCPEPLAAQEQRLLRMLDSAARWRVTGNTLQLEDAAGRSLALLEAIYF
jgi:copper homeostasis protein (lipoprotein)